MCVRTTRHCIAAMFFRVSVCNTRRISSSLCIFDKASACNLLLIVSMRVTAISRVSGSSLSACLRGIKTSLSPVNCSVCAKNAMPNRWLSRKRKSTGRSQAHKIIGGKSSSSLVAADIPGEANCSNAKEKTATNVAGRLTWLDS